MIDLDVFAQTFHSAAVFLAGMVAFIIAAIYNGGDM